MDYILSIFAGVVASIIGFLTAYGNEKGKNLASKEDFELLTEQLSTNTELVENIKKTLSERSWIDQQVWLRKQETYEKIFEKLLLVKQHSHHQSNEFQSHLYLDREHEYYLSHDGYTWANNPNLKKDLERKQKEFQELIKSDEYKAEAKKLNEAHEEAISWLM